MIPTCLTLVVQLRVVLLVPVEETIREPALIPMLFEAAPVLMATWLVKLEPQEPTQISGSTVSGPMDTTERRIESATGLVRDENWCVVPGVAGAGLEKAKLSSGLAVSPVTSKTTRQRRDWVGPVTAIVVSPPAATL
jgi:hypothetical protein